MQIHNFYLNRIYNALDAPIRFVYCRTGPFSRILNRLMFWKLYASDLATLDSRFQDMIRLLGNQPFDVKDKIVLELGPGNSYLNAYAFLLMGARKVWLVDKFPRNLSSGKQRDFHNREIKFIKDKFPGRDLFFLDSHQGLKPEFIECVSRDLTELKNISVDFIYSISVLEHLKKISDNIQTMASLLKPGGLMYHHIDLRDHYNFSAPFLFYKYSDQAWDKWLTKEGLSYTNRWRYGDYLESFSQNKLEVVAEAKTTYPEPPVRLNSKYANQANLTVGLLDIVLERTA